MSEEYSDGMYNDWQDNTDSGLDSLQLLDRWFGSPVWKSICIDADTGCTDSQELMETCSEFLRELVFHLENNSPKSRIDYEMKMFGSVIEPYLK